MATERQIAANQQNAQSSTGPRSDPGKAASSRNAATHNLTAKGLIILPGQEDDFTQLESGMRATLIPDGPLQEIIFKRALESAWSLERCRQAALKLYRTSDRPDVDPILDNSNNNEPRYSRVQRYAREAENSMYKAMRVLGKLQEEARYRQQAFPLTPAQSEDAGLFAQTPHALSQVCSFNQVMKSIIANCRNNSKTRSIHATAAAPLPIKGATRIEANSVGEPPKSNAAVA